MASMPPPNSALAQLAEALSEEDARELTRVFLKEYPALRERLGCGNPKTGRLAAHSLKSSAQHMGATALAGRMAELERRLEKPGAEVTPQDLAAIDRDFEVEAAPLRAFAGE